MYETRRWVYHDEYWPSTELRCVKTVQDDNKILKYYSFSFFEGDELDGDYEIYKMVTIKARIKDDKYIQCGVIYSTSPYDRGWYSWNNVTGECRLYWINEDNSICHDYWDGFDWKYEDLLNDDCESFISVLAENADDYDACDIVSEQYIIRDLLLTGKEDLEWEIQQRFREYSIIRQTLEFKEEDFKYLVEKGYTKY